MAVEHKYISDPDIHEPKGASTAPAGTILTANGLGGTSFQSPFSLVKNGNRVTLSGEFNDIGTADAIWFVSPFNGRISAVRIVLYGPITGSAETITGTINGVPIGDLSITINTSGSAAGVVYSDTSITTGNTVVAGGSFSINTTGASTGVTKAAVFVDITLT
jgi:hypothetical protein